MAAPADESTCIFAFAVETDAWDHYAKYRPSYPAAMWTAWLAYHQGPLDTVLDVGTGNGIGAAGLLAVARAQGRHVRRVCLSDPNADNLAAARKALTPARFPGTEFLFHRGPAEDPFPGLAPRSVDMLLSCASIHWMDIDAAMATFAATLRAGGTFGAVVYPQPTVLPRSSSNDADDDAADDPDGGDALLAQQLGAVFEQRRRFQDAADAAHATLRAVRARCYRNLSVGLDYVPFAAAQWTAVRRRTANLPADGRWPLRDSSWAHYGGAPTVAVAAGEVYERPPADADYVRRGYSVAQLQAFVETLGYEPFVRDGRLWATDAFQAFAATVEARGGTFDLVWPVATTLARAR